MCIRWFKRLFNKKQPVPQPEPAPQPVPPAPVPDPVLTIPYPEESYDSSQNNQTAIE
jgi:hypothetical protein